MDIDDVVIAEPNPAPHPLEQPLAAEHHTRLGRKRVEQVELELGQLVRLAGEPDLTRLRVDLQRVVTDRFGTWAAA